MAKKTAKKFQIGFDVHGDRQDPSAVRVFHEFAKTWKPEIRVAGGDIFDFRCLRKGATDQEKRERLNEDVDAGIDFLKKFKPTQYLLGNHCSRAWDAARGDDGKLADLANYLIQDIEESLGGAQVFPYDKRSGIFHLGSLKVLHGYTTGVMAARHAAQVYGSCVMGHTHTVDSYSIPGLERRVGRIGGCLCLLSQDYNRAQMNTLRQSHGFGYGIVNSDGTFVYYQAEPIDGVWYLPTEFRELKAA